MLFRAEGRKVSADDDRRLAWQQLAAGGLEICTVPGDDSGAMLEEPHVPWWLPGSRSTWAAAAHQSGALVSPGGHPSALVVEAAGAVGAGLLSGLCSAGLIAVISTGLSRVDLSRTLSLSRSSGWCWGRSEPTPCRAFSSTTSASGP